MENLKIEIRKMHCSDIDSLMRLKNYEKWNQTEKDWEILINYNNSINLIALLEGIIVGTITEINYDNKVAWIGMMLVDKDHRGKGISKLLLNDAIKSLENKCDYIKLDATPSGRPVYKKIGFIDEYTLNRMTNPSVSIINFNTVNVELMKFDDIYEVAEFDKNVFGADRSDLIKALYEGYPELAWVIKHNNKIKGFCLGRKGTNFTQIGPVFALSEKHAKALIASAVNQIIGQPVVVDIHEAKIDYKQWLTANGFITQRQFERMYLKQNIHYTEVDKQYIIAGPEFG